MEDEKNKPLSAKKTTLDVSGLPDLIRAEVEKTKQTVSDLVMGCLAVSMKAPEVIRTVKRHSGMTISKQLVSYYRINHQAGIAEIRESYLKNLINLVPIANLINRSLLRQKLIDDLNKPSKLWRKVPHFHKGEICGYHLEGSHETINKILDIVTTMVKKLNLAITLPDIRPINDDVSISVNSGDEDILALIFAAFNYLEKNKLRTGELWKISRIKIINVNSYFNADMPNIHDDEGFMTNEETETFIKKVLTNFKNKLNHEKVD